jgi:hypothetical protein
MNISAHRKRVRPQIAKPELNKFPINFDQYKNLVLFHFI